MTDEVYSDSHSEVIVRCCPVCMGVFLRYALSFSQEEPTIGSDCAVVIDWQFDALGQFAVAANESSDWALPWWLTLDRARGTITSQDISESIARQLAREAPASPFLHCFLSPVTFVQLGNMVACLKEIEADPFTQQCMRNIPAGVMLLQLFCMCPGEDPEPFNFHSRGADKRQLFM